MSESTKAKLQRAYELIEEDELLQAQALLAPLLDSESENPAVWWVYSHAASERAVGKMALERVLALDPQYPGARELLADLKQLQHEGSDGLEPVSSFSALPSGDEDIVDWEALQPSTAPASGGGNRRWLVLLILLLLVVASGAALLATGVVDLEELFASETATAEPRIVVVEPVNLEAQPNRGGQTEPALATPSSRPTSQVLLATVPPDATAESEAVDIAATAIPAAATATLPPTATSTATEVPILQVTALTDGEREDLDLFITEIVRRIDSFDIDQSGVETGMTGLGRTVLIPICAVPGREFNFRLNNVMEVVSDVALSIPDFLDAVAAGLRNCYDDASRLRIIAAKRADFLAYQAGESELKDFQRAWQPLF